MFVWKRCQLNVFQCAPLSFLQWWETTVFNLCKPRPRSRTFKASATKSSHCISHQVLTKVPYTYMIACKCKRTQHSVWFWFWISDILFDYARYVVINSENGDPNAMTYSHTEKDADGNDRQMCVSIQKREGIEKYPQVIKIHWIRLEISH